MTTDPKPAPLPIDVEAALCVLRELCSGRTTSNLAIATVREHIDALRERVAELEAQCETARHTFADILSFNGTMFGEKPTRANQRTLAEFIDRRIDEFLCLGGGEALAAAKREAVREFVEELRYRGCTDKDDYLMVHESHIDELLAALDAEPGGGEEG